MPRFVVLLHECMHDRPRATHCDLMFEAGETLRTWAMCQLPQDWKFPAAPSFPCSTSNTIELERLADHRLAYLDYEGPVSGDRGSVRQLDAGTLRELRGLRSYELSGRFIRGRVDLEPLESDAAKWQLRFTRQ